MKASGRHAPGQRSANSKSTPLASAKPVSPTVWRYQPLPISRKNAGSASAPAAPASGQRKRAHTRSSAAGWNCVAHESSTPKSSASSRRWVGKRCVFRRKSSVCVVTIRAASASTATATNSHGSRAKGASLLPRTASSSSGSSR